MIIRKHMPAIESRTSEGWGTVETQRVGDAGGLTQFGASVQTLLPGARSSLSHWHEATDELLYVLSGDVTVTENEVDHVLHVGDCASWPAGMAVSHTVSNRSAVPCTYLVVGTRAMTDVTHYEEIGEIMHMTPTGWRMSDRHGNVVRQGKADENPWA